MPKLDEKQFRRAGFDESRSHPVVMGDGGTWFLPKPHMRTRFVFRDKKVAGRVLVTDDPEFDGLVKAVEEHDTYSDAGNLAAYLLLSNYDLTEEQLSEVLEYDPKDQSEDRWPVRVLDVAFGHTGPKA